MQRGLPYQMMYLQMIICMYISILSRFGLWEYDEVIRIRWREVLKWGVNAQGFSQALRLNTLRTLRSWGGCFLGNLLRPTRGRHRETYSLSNLSLENCFPSGVFELHFQYEGVDKFKFKFFCKIKFKIFNSQVFLLIVVFQNSWFPCADLILLL